jgi:hypothetical protein
MGIVARFFHLFLRNRPVTGRITLKRDGKKLFACYGCGAAAPIASKKQSFHAAAGENEHFAVRPRNSCNLHDFRGRQGKTGLIRLSVRLRRKLKQKRPSFHAAAGEKAQVRPAPTPTAEIIKKNQKRGCH